MIVVFFKTRAPVEPVAFVERICRDLAAGVQLQNCRYVKRLTPITKVEKANQKGVERWFLGVGGGEKKVSTFAVCFVRLSLAILSGPSAISVDEIANAL
jgi:hypothetical protein